MIWRWRWGNIKFTMGVRRTTHAIGVDSELDSGLHILMWDFDEIPLPQVCDALRAVQTRYFLSDIHILRTKEPDNYIAYCFSAFGWRTAVEIVAQTEYVDWQFFRFGVYRGHFTLRVTPKGKLKCPKCHSKNVAECKGGTNLVEIPSIDFICMECQYEFGRSEANYITPYLVRRLDGYELPCVKPEELKNWVRYETANWR